MEEVEAGRVEAIVIKDMSRLGRDYLKVGQVMEVLRQRGVRLIAINDGVDSLKGDDDFTPVPQHHEEHKLFGKGVLLNHSFSTKRCGSIANRFHRMLSGVGPDCGCSRVFSFSHYTTPTKR